MGSHYRLEDWSIGMLDRMRQATAGYPRQFRLLFWGMLINAAGGSMI